MKSEWENRVTGPLGQEMEYGIYESCHYPLPSPRNQGLAFELEGSTIQARRRVG